MLCCADDVPSRAPHPGCFLRLGGQQAFSLAAHLEQEDEEDRQLQDEEDSSGMRKTTAPAFGETKQPLAWVISAPTIASGGL